jgi:hypothetical protein
VDNITCMLTELKYSKMYCTSVPLRFSLFRGYGKQNKACDNKKKKKIINVITWSEFLLSLLISLKANMTVQNMFPSSLCPPSKTFFHKAFCMLICFPHQRWNTLNTKSYSESLSAKIDTLQCTQILKIFIKTDFTKYWNKELSLKHRMSGCLR